MRRERAGSYVGDRTPMNEDITRPIRHYRITAILNRKRVNSQNQLMSLLEKEGISVTQATLSRDLNELGAKKMRPLEGPAYYLSLIHI